MMPTPTPFIVYAIEIFDVSHTICVRVEEFVQAVKYNNTFESLVDGIVHVNNPSPPPLRACLI